MSGQVRVPSLPEHAAWVSSLSGTPDPHRKAQVGVCLAFVIFLDEVGEQEAAAVGLSALADLAQEWLGVRPPWAPADGVVRRRPLPVPPGVDGAGYACG